MVSAAAGLIVGVAARERENWNASRIGVITEYVFTLVLLAVLCALAVGLQKHLIARLAVVVAPSPTNVLRRE